MKHISFRFFPMLLTLVLLSVTEVVAQTYERTFSFNFTKENMSITEDENGYFIKPDRLVYLWSYNDDGHKPALPYIRYEILLPDNFQVKSFSFLSKEEEEYPRAITLGTNSLPMPTEEGTDNEEGSSLYPLITYPAEVLLFEESIMDGYRIALFLINPFTYYAESRKLWLTTEMNLRIIVEPVDKDEEVGHVGTMKDIVKSSVYNPEDMDAGTENWTKIEDSSLQTIDYTPNLKKGVNISVNSSTLLCTSPTAVKLEIYTLDAVKVGEARFTHGEATVRVDKVPATYLYIVTYPDGRRESGKVMMK